MRLQGRCRNGVSPACAAAISCFSSPRPCSSIACALGLRTNQTPRRRPHGSCRRNVATGDRARPSPRRPWPCGQRSHECPWQHASALWLAVRPFRIHVDQSHLDRCQRILEVAVAAVAFVAKPLGLHPPVDIFDSGSQTSSRPPPNPNVLKPIDSRAQLPARIMQVSP